MAEHGDFTTSNGIHPEFQWSYANQAARLAAVGFVAGDVNKLAIETDTYAVYRLTGTAPITWVYYAGGTGSSPTGFLLANGTVAGGTSQAQDFGTNGITADVIAESTGAAGVTIDNNVLITDGLTTTGAVVDLGTKETTVVANDILGRINFYAPLEASGSDAVLVSASIAAAASATFSPTVNNTDLLFQTGQSETATTKMILAAGGVLKLDNGGIRPIADGVGALELQKVNGTAVISIDTSNDRVGIGTTSPTVPLDVYGNETGGYIAQIDNDHTSAAHVLRLDTDATGSGSYFLTMFAGATEEFRFTAEGAFLLNSGLIRPFADSTTALRVQSQGGGSEIMNFDTSNDRVGIGTTSPQRIFHVESTGPITRQSDSDAGTDAAVVAYHEWYRGNNTNRIGFLGYGSGSNENLTLGNETTNGLIEFKTNSTAQWSIRSSGDLVAESSGSGVIRTETDGTPDITIANQGGTAILTVDTVDDRVGIGTTAPGVDLHVVANGSASTPATGVIAAFDRNATSGTSAYIAVNAGIGGAAGIHFGDTGDSDIGRILYDHASEQMEFWVNNLEMLRIRSDGDWVIDANASGIFRNETDAANGISFTNNAKTVTVLSIDTASDRVGIQTTTPSNPLQVDQDTTINSETTYGIKVDDGTAAYGLMLGASSATGAALIQSIDPGTSFSTIPLVINGQGTAPVGIGSGATSPSGKLHVDQSSATGAIPVLYLDQADVDQPMIQFETTIGVGNAVEAVGAKTLTVTHYIMVELPGGLTRYIEAGTIA